MPRHKQSDQSTIKNQVIRLRVTETEAQLFKANATVAGCKSISEFIRSRCIDDSSCCSSGVDTAEKTVVK